MIGGAVVNKNEIKVLISAGEKCFDERTGGTTSVMDGDDDGNEGVTHNVYYISKSFMIEWMYEYSESTE